MILPHSSTILPCKFLSHCFFLNFSGHNLVGTESYLAITEGDKRKQVPLGVVAVLDGFFVYNSRILIVLNACIINFLR